MSATEKAIAATIIATLAAAVALALAWKAGAL